MKDIFGRAILDYQLGNYTDDIITETSISDKDVLPLPYLFRDYKEMPKIEQKALQMTHGKVLDVGCGAGSHSLYLQNKRKLDVTAIDISEGAIEACKLRGIKKTIHGDVMQLNGTFDTILLLMNGAGMCGKLNRMTTFLKHLKSLLTEQGQILVDSSDIIYMFDEDEDGGKWIPSETAYYGELIFNMSYKGMQKDSFDWLYIDYNTLQNVAIACGFKCELVLEGKHYDYLARLSKKHKKVIENKGLL